MPDALEFEKKLVELENELAELRAEPDSPRSRDRIELDFVLFRPAELEDGTRRDAAGRPGS